MVKSLNKLKDEFLDVVRQTPDSGSCSIGHGLWISKNGKREFWDMTRYTQGTSQISEALSNYNGFSDEGYSIDLEYGVMD